MYVLSQLFILDFEPILPYRKGVESSQNGHYTSKEYIHEQYPTDPLGPSKTVGPFHIGLR